MKLISDWICAQPIKWPSRYNAPCFESALTLWFRLPLFEISEFLSILTSRCGPTSHDLVLTCFSALRQLRTIRRLVSLVMFCVLSHIEYGNATLTSIPNTFFGGYSPLWMQQLDSSTRRLILATSLCFFINSTGWARCSWLQMYHTLPMNLGDLLIRMPSADFGRRHCHH